MQEQLRLPKSCLPFGPSLLPATGLPAPMAQQLEARPSSGDPSSSLGRMDSSDFQESDDLFAELTATLALPADALDELPYDTVLDTSYSPPAQTRPADTLLHDPTFHAVLPRAVSQGTSNAAEDVPSAPSTQPCKPKRRVYLSLEAGAALVDLLAVCNACGLPEPRTMVAHLVREDAMVMGAVRRPVPGAPTGERIVPRQSRLIEEEGNATRRAFNLINHALDSLDCLPHRTRHLSNSYQVARERVWSGVSAEEYPAQAGLQLDMAMKQAAEALRSKRDQLFGLPAPQDDLMVEPAAAPDEQGAPEPPPEQPPEALRALSTGAPLQLFRAVGPSCFKSLLCRSQAIACIRGVSGWTSAAILMSCQGLVRRSEVDGAVSSLKLASVPIKTVKSIRPQRSSNLAGLHC
ncbi:hypothetical protein WJX84_012287 [Apatococcus fuscideae]|uniref:Uncharacterized protein n=1 Tax=Apatococcus fuscideae TaxID=2026836 RepID=A0AAW1T7H6_9CHLO